MDVINSGTDLLVEKPIADSVENGEAIVRAAEKKKVKFMVGHIERFNPAVIKMKELIDSGELGKIVSVNTRRVGPYNPRIRDVGVILDIGVHDIDIISYLLGSEVSEVYAIAGADIHSQEDHASIMLRFGENRAGIVETNWLTPHKSRQFTVIGTGGLGERIWSGPAITVTGIDVLPVDKAVNAVVPHARAKVSLRVHPEQDPVEAQAALIRHLEEQKPFGIPLTVHALETGTGFAAKTDGPAYGAAREALGSAWGSETVSIATGGSIPLVNALQQAVPEAEMLLFGTTDGFANIHAPNERVVVDEFEKAVLAEAEFFGLYAGQRSA
jgi:hypothetical protein